ncbi:MAG: UPF0175 family protein [Nitrospirae bacterium]|nr:UPF0175 family protein [Nitrospirota bacterium]
MPKQVILEFPVDLPDETLKEQEIFQKVKVTLVLELLRKEEISQGKAAELLGITRYELFDLMAEYNVPMAGFSIEELRRQRKEIS